MKTMKFLMILIMSIILFTACLSSPVNRSLQSDIDEQEDWQTYTNRKYQFSVRLPSAWKVIELPTPEHPAVTDQVWFVSHTAPPPQTDAKADIVLIFTQEDPSPSWNAQYFDEYETGDFWIGDIQAKRISGINKESNASELVVLSKIGDFFLQALPNLGEASLEYFEPVISSMRFVQVQATQPPDSTRSIPGDVDEKTFDFEGISLSYSSMLAEEVEGKHIPAFIDPSGFMYNDHPEHIRIDFSKSYTAQEPFSTLQPGKAPWVNHQNPENPEIMPQIFIFPTGEYVEISPMAAERIDGLKIILDNDTLPSGVDLPVLPTFNSTQDLRGQVARLEFQGGQGVRFIARYSQGVAPVVNPNVFYTFQGLTEDGRLYVAAFFPLYVSLLPEQVQVEDLDSFNLSYKDYLAKTTSELGELSPNEFEPDIDTLDALIESISILNNNAFTSKDTQYARDMPTTELQCFVTGFSPVAFMPDGDRILVRAENGVQIFNLKTMEQEEFLEAPTKLIYPAIALSPDGEILAWALEDFSIQLIRISDKQLLQTLTGHTDIVGKLSFSPDGERLYSASHDTWVREWDMEGKLMHAFQPPGALDIPNEILGIGISPDGTMLATIPFDGPVKLWNLKDFKLVRELRGLAGGSGGYDTSDISFSPDGYLVAADLATGLFLWKTLDGTELLGGNPGINTMAMDFSPDGRFLAYSEIGEKFDVVISSPDGTEKIQTLEGHPAPIGIMFFSPDSSLLLTSDWVETRIWQVEDGQQLYIGKSSCP